MDCAPEIEMPFGPFWFTPGDRMTADVTVRAVGSFPSVSAVYVVAWAGDCEIASLCAVTVVVAVTAIARFASSVTCCEAPSDFDRVCVLKPWIVNVTWYGPGGQVRDHVVAVRARDRRARPLKARGLRRDGDAGQVERVVVNAARKRGRRQALREDAGAARRPTSSTSPRRAT